MQKLNLNNIPICDQIWDEMPLSERGRICQKCQTEIIDFRKMSDLEIAYEHSKSDERVCGIYNKRQLTGQKLPQQKIPKSILVGIFGFLSTFNVSGNDFVKKEKIVQLENDYSINQKVSLKKEKMDTSKVNIPFLIKGQIRGKYSCGLSGISIFVLNSRNGTISDENGLFSLVLDPNQVKNESVDLIFSVPNLGRRVKSYSFDELLNQNIYVDFNSKCETIHNIKTTGITVKEEITISFRVRRQPIYKRVIYKIKGVLFRKQKNKNAKTKSK